MKKALLYGLSAVMLLSLTACGTAQANQPDEPSPTPSAVHTEPPQESPAVTPAPENAVEPLSAGQEPTGEVSKDELQKLFEQAYENGQIYAELGIEGEDLIQLEFDGVSMIFDVRTDIKAPADLEAQYRAWRAEAHPAPVQAETQLFADCNEVVYAKDQVNIRSSYSTDSTKLGSLTAGQSITRIGTAIPGTEAEGWSKVQFSDGTIAYMVSSYLSTSKPTAQSRPSGGGTQQQQQQPSGGNTVQDNSGGTIGFDFNAHEIDTSQTRTAEETGYKPIDPSHIIYGD